MSDKEVMNRIKQNAQRVKQTVGELKNELNIITTEYNAMLVRQLKEENIKLSAAVEDAKNKLIQLEIQNGIKQIPVPNQTSTPVIETSLESNTVVNEKQEVKNEAAIKPQKEKKEKKPKEQKATEELPIDVGRLDLRIGKIVDIKRHPDADTLYLLQVNVGEEKPRTVCSGLVKHILMEDLKDKTVVMLCNLKPVKMRGINSEAMVMCASSESGVETIIPPENSLPGDLVYCEGYTRQPDPVMNPKKKIFETVAPDLHTNENLEACYKDAPFQVAGKGICHSKTLKNVHVK